MSTSADLTEKETGPDNGTRMGRSRQFSVEPPKQSDLQVGVSTSVWTNLLRSPLTPILCLRILTWVGMGKWFMDWVPFSVAVGRYQSVSAVLILIIEVLSHMQDILFSATVFEGQTGLVLKFGKYSRAVDPGLTKVNPYIPIDVFSDYQIEREITTCRRQNPSRRGPTPSLYDKRQCQCPHHLGHLLPYCQSL